MDQLLTLLLFKWTNPQIIHRTQMDQPQINPQIPMMQMDQPSISEDSNGPTYKYLLFQMKVLLQIAEYNT
jgi:hypothetical protein